MTEPPAVLDPMEQAEGILKATLSRHDLSAPLTALLLDAGIPALAREISLRPGQFRERPLPPDAQPPQDMEKPDIKAAAESVILPVMPEVAMKLERVTGDPGSTAGDVADVISLDPGLSTILLHVVNSAFYNFPQAIDSIPRAVSMVGTSQLHALALGRMVLAMANEISPKNFDMDVYWEHSIATGILARELAGLCGLENPERHFLAGLLHDTGKLAIAAGLPGHVEILAARRRGVVSYEAEREVLGFDHARFGGLILRKWDIPYQIVEAVANHHHPEKARHRNGARILHLADIMARTLVVTDREVPLTPPLDQQAWQALGLEPEDLAQIIDGLEEKMREMVTILTARK
ncbi:HDOD domain-containing protein [Desulfocurvus sp. DL9XJH121]